MIDRLEKRIAEQDQLLVRFKPIRRYFEDILNDVPSAHIINGYKESIWEFKFRPFTIDGKEYELAAETLPTKDLLINSPIKLTLWSKNYKDITETEWLPPVNNFDSQKKDTTEKMLSDLEKIVESLKKQILPGYI